MSYIPVHLQQLTEPICRQMGLGKTAQSIAALEYQRQLCGKHGPFLVRDTNPPIALTAPCRLSPWQVLSAVYHFHAIDEQHSGEALQMGCPCLQYAHTQ